MLAAQSGAAAKLEKTEHETAVGPVVAARLRAASFAALAPLATAAVLVAAAPHVEMPSVALAAAAQGASAARVTAHLRGEAPLGEAGPVSATASNVLRVVFGRVLANEPLMFDWRGQANNDVRAAAATAEAAAGTTRQALAAGLGLDPSELRLLATGRWCPTTTRSLPTT